MFHGHSQDKHNTINHIPHKSVWPSIGDNINLNLLLKVVKQMKQGESIK